MQSRIARMLIVVSLVVMVGGHWAVLQSVAWVGMALNFAQTAPLSIALKKTFDGKNPCTLCKAVNEGKKSEREQAVLKVETKLDFYLTASAFLLDAPPFVAIEPGAAEVVQPRAHAPPRQPPRFA